MAINDRVANSGDYLYVLEVSGDTVKLLRQPEDGGKYTLLNRAFPNPRKAEIIRCHVNALEWLTPHKLLVGVRQDYIHPGYHEDAKRIILKY